MYCSLSGQQAKEPVVSPRSGKIFEKHLIVTYLASNGKDPISDEPLRPDELVHINVDGDNNDVNNGSSAVVPPKPPTFNSIPSLLSTFQNEFDSMALEIFTLRKLLNTCKQELSSALYHYDAAVKVAASAIKERDETKQALQDLSTAVGNGSELTEENEENELDGRKVPVDLIETTRAKLFQHHKTQKSSLYSPQDLILPSVINKEPIAKYNVYYFDEKLGRLLLNHGKEIEMKDLGNGDVIGSTKLSHKGGLRLLNLILVDDLITPVYATKRQIKFNSVSINYPQEIVDIKSHPELKQLYVVSTKLTWTLNDQDQKLLEVNVDKTITTSEFHIDGELFAVGTDVGDIAIYSIKDGSSHAVLATKYSIVTKLQFAQNGYWLIVLSKDPKTKKSAIEIYDLRKSMIINAIEFDKDDLMDFVMEKSCGLLITLNKDRYCTHEYVKKGKTWSNFYGVLPIKHNYQHIFISTHDEHRVEGVMLTDNELATFHLW